MLLVNALSERLIRYQRSRSVCCKIVKDLYSGTDLGNSMGSQKVERKLAAILAADVAGYSRLMGRGEEATLQRLKVCRKVIDGLIGEHRGRIFGSAGDSVIAEFPSSVDAVECAVAIQQALDEHNTKLPQDQCMAFRIGINLGDVMIEGDNLFGDAVNVAARLEGLAKPGAICVSGDVYRYVKNKLEFKVEDLGERKVKNIAEPVHVYQITPESAAVAGNDRGESPASAAARDRVELPDAPCVLVVDDDPDVRGFLQDYLSEHDYQVLVAESAQAVRALMAERVPDVVLLDVGLPGEDGLSLARYLREHFNMGIIMVSGAGETMDRIIGLEIGADDYVAKPFEPRELLARIKGVLRRYRRPADEPRDPPAPAPEAGASSRRVRVGRCMLDLDSHQLFDVEEHEITLTRMEFDLLKVFVERPNRPLSRDQILNLTQNRDWDPFDRSLDIRIARLRRKLEADPEKPEILKTVRGVGYMFVSGSPEGGG